MEGRRREGMREERERRRTYKVVNFGREKSCDGICPVILLLFSFLEEEE